MKTNKSKQQKQSKKIVIIGTIVLVVSIIIAVAVILNVKKEESQKYGGMEFNTKMNLSNVNLIESSDEIPEQVPVPKGYTASSVESERTVKGGFVIYEGEEKVTEGNLEEAKKTRNQFVWIPIEEASDMYYMSGNNMYGAYYTFTATGYKRGTRTYEPSVVSYDKDSTNLTIYMNGITRDKFLREMQQSFYEMIKSVETYGGYYIGRYETGNLSKNEPVIVKMNTDIHSVNWYNMYKRSKRIRGLKENVTTGMIWGIQFDEALKWLIDSGSKTNVEIAKDSTSWGNYFNATFTYTNKLGITLTKSRNRTARIPTGSSEYTVANNIYDLAGNVWEWTMEGNVSNDRYSYGGSYSLQGMLYPAHYRNNYYYPDRSSIYTRLQGVTLYQVALSSVGDALEYISRSSFEALALKWQ